MKKKDRISDVTFSKQDDDWRFVNITDGKPYTLTDRAATVLMYLRTMPQPEGGGNTSFPMLDRFGNVLSKEDLKLIRKKNKNKKKKKREKQKQQQEQQQQDEVLHVESSCDPEDHLTISPEAGKILIFYDMKEDGTFEPKSSHAGCAVLGDKHAKFTMTKWLQIPLP